MVSDNKSLHRPIFLSEIIELLAVRPDGVYVDATFGDGGHSLAILEKKPYRLISLDRDSETLELFTSRQPLPNNLELINIKMSEFSKTLSPDSLEGVLIDLGVSTRQLLTPHRGFSFREEGPLDMRMGKEGSTLLEILEDIEEEDLSEALRVYAEVKGSYRIAKKIKEKVNAGELKTTLDIAQLFPPKKPYEKNHPATQTFLALRMLVNQELEEIRESLPYFIRALKPGGRLIVLSFHSVEDRLVKQIFKVAAGRCVCDERVCQCSKLKVVKWIEKITSPSQAEIENNPRSRSTRLRAVEKNALIS